MENKIFNGYNVLVDTEAKLNNLDIVYFEGWAEIPEGIYTLFMSDIYKSNVYLYKNDEIVGVISKEEYMSKKLHVIVGIDYELAKIEMPDLITKIESEDYTFDEIKMAMEFGMAMKNNMEYDESDTDRLKSAIRFKRNNDSKIKLIYK